MRGEAASRTLATRCGSADENAEGSENADNEAPAEAPTLTLAQTLEPSGGDE